MTNQFQTQTDIQQQVEREQYQLFKSFLDKEQNQIQQRQQEGATVVDETVEPVTTEEQTAADSSKETGETNETTDEVEEDEIIPIVDEVSKQFGIELKVDYPDGVLPDSPEGVYAWANALMDHKEKDVLNNFKASYPDAYKMALWTEAGNDPKDFNATISNPKFEDIKDNLDIQKQLFLRSYKEKDVDEDDAKALLESAIKKGNLASSVENYLKKDGDRAEKEAESLRQQIANRDQEIEDAHNEFGDVLKQIYNTKVFDLVRIPDAKVNESFDKFVQNVVYNEKEKIFEYRVPITNATVKDLIPLDYMKNNKAEFIKNKTAEAQAQGARTLQRTQKNIQAEQKTTTDKGLKADYFK